MVPPWMVSREMWRTYGVSADVLLFSGSGAPLIHCYRVFGRGGVNASLRGGYMTKLRVFTVQVEAEGWWACGRDPTQSSSLQKGSAHPRDVWQRDPDGGSPPPPRCEAHQAMSPRTSDVPAGHVSPAAASSPASRSPSRSLRRVAVSSGDSWSGDSVYRASPVSMVDSVPVVMSIFSSDTDPDMEDELCRFRPLPAPVSPLSANDSMRVVESQLHYTASAVPVMSSAVSS